MVKVKPTQDISDRNIFENLKGEIEIRHKNINYNLKPTGENINKIRKWKEI